MSNERRMGTQDRPPAALQVFDSNLTVLSLQVLTSSLGSRLANTGGRAYSSIEKYF